MMMRVLRLLLEDRITEVLSFIILYSIPRTCHYDNHPPSVLNQFAIIVIVFLLQKYEG